MRVTEVSLLEDRAQVTRRGRVELASGPQRVVVEGVAAVIVDKTIAVRFEGASVHLIEARIERRTLVRDADRSERIQPLLAEARALDHRIEGLEARRSGAHHEGVQLASMLDMAHAEIAEDVAFGRSSFPTWGESLDAIGEKWRAAELEREGLEHELEVIREERERLGERISSLQQPSDEVSSDLRLELDVGSAGEVEIEVRYVVPGACWRPIHVAELEEGDDEAVVGFRTEACIWQNTGEDWNDVRVHLSTERASLGVTPPRLASDEIHTRPKEKDIVVEARQEEVEDAGFGASPGRIRVSDVPGIEDGGEPRELTVARPVHVPSDGRPVRVHLDESRCEAELSWVVMAERVSKVLVKTVLENRGVQPLLPGPVELIRRGGLVGRTSIPFVAAGERFELGWGPDPELRVARFEREKKSKSSALSAWTTVPREVEVLISNLGADPRTVEVVECIPVSEIEKVKITPRPEETSEGVQPDRDGILRWRVRIEPFARERRRLVYELEKHADVVGL